MCLASEQRLTWWGAQAAAPPSTAASGCHQASLHTWHRPTCHATAAALACCHPAPDALSPAATNKQRWHKAHLQQKTSTKPQHWDKAHLLQAVMYKKQVNARLCLSFHWCELANLQV